MKNNNFKKIIRHYLNRLSKDNTLIISTLLTFLFLTSFSFLARENGTVTAIKWVLSKMDIHGFEFDVEGLKNNWIVIFEATKNLTFGYFFITVIKKLFWEWEKEGEDRTIMNFLPGVKRKEIFLSKILASFLLTFFFFVFSILPGLAIVRTFHYSNYFLNFKRLTSTLLSETLSMTLRKFFFFSGIMIFSFYCGENYITKLIRGTCEFFSKLTLNHWMIWLEVSGIFARDSFLSKLIRSLWNPKNFLFVSFLQTLVVMTMIWMSMRRYERKDFHSAVKN